MLLYTIQNVTMESDRVEAGSKEARLASKKDYDQVYSEQSLWHLLNKCYLNVDVFKSLVYFNNTHVCHYNVYHQIWCLFIYSKILYRQYVSWHNGVICYSMTFCSVKWIVCWNFKRDFLPFLNVIQKCCRVWK